jgi:peptidyl-dipeptidase Dcp
MENWTSEKEALDLFAEHYQTGEKIPSDLAKKIKDAQRFQAGYAMLRQLGFSYLDMAWHSADPSKIDDITAFEVKALEKSRLVPFVEGTLVSTGFSHIFAGGYSAGYYSYKWAEVLDADAFEYIKSKGLFNRDVTMKFKNEVLSRGGTEHPMTLYKRFRGQEPDANALLRRAGLIDGQAR